MRQNVLCWVTPFLLGVVVDNNQDCFCDRTCFKVKKKRNDLTNIFWITYLFDNLKKKMFRVSNRMYKAEQRLDNAEFY